LASARDWVGFFDGPAIAACSPMLEDPGGLNPLTDMIIGCGVTVHREFGAGLLESVYAQCFILELRATGLRVETERRIPLVYRGGLVHRGFRIDLIVEDLVVIEVKSVSTLTPIHSAQLITYLKLTGCPVGLLMNFNGPKLTDGVKRLVHPAQKT
jgi:GxxExxY protein